MKFENFWKHLLLDKKESKARATMYPGFAQSMNGAQCMCVNLKFKCRRVIYKNKS